MIFSSENVVAVVAGGLCLASAIVEESAIEHVEVLTDFSLMSLSLVGAIGGGLFAIGLLPSEWSI